MRVFSKLYLWFFLFIAPGFANDSIFSSDLQILGCIIDQVKQLNPESSSDEIKQHIRHRHRIIKAKMIKDIYNIDPTRNPQTVNSYPSANRYLKKTIYPLVKDHVVNMKAYSDAQKVLSTDEKNKGTDNRISVEDAYSLDSIIFRLTLLEFIIEEVQSFSRYSEYKHSLFTDAQDNTKKIVSEFVPADGVMRNTTSLPLQIATSHIYKALLQHVFCQENTCDPLVLGSVVGLGIKEFFSIKAPEVVPLMNIYVQNAVPQINTPPRAIGRQDSSWDPSITGCTHKE